MRRLWFVLGLMLILSFGCPQTETAQESLEAEEQPSPSFPEPVEVPETVVITVDYENLTEEPDEPEFNYNIVIVPKGQTNGSVDGSDIDCPNLSVQSAFVVPTRAPTYLELQYWVDSDVLMNNVDWKGWSIGRLSDGSIVPLFCHRYGRSVGQNINYLYCNSGLIQKTVSHDGGSTTNSYISSWGYLPSGPSFILKEILYLVSGNEVVCSQLISEDVPLGYTPETYAPGDTDLSCPEIEVQSDVIPSPSMPIVNEDAIYLNTEADYWIDGALLEGSVDFNGWNCPKSWIHVRGKYECIPMFCNRDEETNEVACMWLGSMYKSITDSEGRVLEYYPYHVEFIYTRESGKPSLSLKRIEYTAMPEWEEACVVEVKP